MQLTPEAYFERWRLTSPKLLAETDTSRIYKVRHREGYAALKWLTETGRRVEGGAPQILGHFGGNGAVTLFEADEGAHLMAYLEGPSLDTLTAAGRDEEAAHIIAATVERLHASTATPPAGLKTLAETFETLHRKAFEPGSDPVLETASTLARRLLSDESKRVVLHGDLHHQNILHSAEHGWLAIDPQAMFGDPAYDLANSFFSPDEPQNLVETPDRMVQYARIYSERLGLDRQRILDFAFVCGALSVCWFIEDGKSPERRLNRVRLLEHAGLVSPL